MYFDLLRDTCPWWQSEVDDQFLHVDLEISGKDFITNQAFCCFMLELAQRITNPLLKFLKSQRVFGKLPGSEKHWILLFAAGSCRAELDFMSLKYGTWHEGMSSRLPQMGVSKNSGYPQFHPLKNRVFPSIFTIQIWGKIPFFHYKPSILGYPYSWKHPNHGKHLHNFRFSTWMSHLWTARNLEMSLQVSMFLEESKGEGIPPFFPKDPWDERYIYLHGWLIYMVKCR